MLHVVALYEDKIYSVGGTVTGVTNDTISGMPYKEGTTERLTDPFYLDSYLRIVDFSQPVDPSKNSIDISTDKITTVIRLPDNIPRVSGGTLFISAGVMHMLPGKNTFPNISDADGNILSTTAYRTNLSGKVWNFDLSSQEWEVHPSGIEDPAEEAAIAFDAEKQVGWYYGGKVSPDSFLEPSMSTRALHDLYRLDKGEETPIKVETKSSHIEEVVQGELVYIGGVGEAGILVLVGGEQGVDTFLLVSPQISIDDPSAFLTNTLLQRSTQTVHVFDIATKTWFAQSTTAEQGFYPSPRAGFCSIVASAQDNSSHNIYIYGGWSQGGMRTYITSDIFILTLPAFHWVSVYPLTGDESELENRPIQNHKCQKLHEKHMVAYRGGKDYLCDNKNLEKFQGMTIFDISSLTWTTMVELENPKYVVPQALYEIIGGK